MRWGIVYYQREDGSIPAEEFFDSIPNKVEANLLAVLEAVRDAPPPAFSGGGKWEVMHGEMGGYYEIRATGPGKTLYRLFCILDNADADGLKARGFTEPQIAVITGMQKASRTGFSDREYQTAVRATLGMITARPSHGESPPEQRNAAVVGDFPPLLKRGVAGDPASLSTRAGRGWVGLRAVSSWVVARAPRACPATASAYTQAALSLAGAGQFPVSRLGETVDQ